ncbi:MAG TPA: hypothetical protein VMB21_19555 [Candidatus Limnocylindria bacterium]|nr:hypothetical protein [Candidatus Limnocylindria bacterium]
MAVEGMSEQAFVIWLQTLLGEDLHIHLHPEPLNGGGYESMYKEAVRLLKREQRKSGDFADRFLILDWDREREDSWSLEKLRSEAAKSKIKAIVQKPNHEGLLLRLLPGKERDCPDAGSVKRKLQIQWPSYEKPMNARDLSRKFSRDDLLRLARVDDELRRLLAGIGLKIDQ